MEGYNFTEAHEHYTGFLRTKLADTLSSMIVNETKSAEFMYVNFKAFDSLFMEAARRFNCDITYIEQVYMALGEVANRKYILVIKPSSIFNNVKTKKEVHDVLDS